jgi:hypothetical protein
VYKRQTVGCGIVAGSALDEGEPDDVADPSVSPEVLVQAPAINAAAKPSTIDDLLRSLLIRHRFQVAS